MSITDERIEEIALDAVKEALRDLVHDRMGQGELLSDYLPKNASEAEVEAACDRLEAEFKRHLAPYEAEQPAEPATERPLVACKAPNPWQPGHFCRRPLGHSGTVCDYVPADQLPDSADDEERENNALLNAEADERDQPAKHPFEDAVLHEADKALLYGGPQ